MKMNRYSLPESVICLFVLSWLSGVLSAQGQGQGQDKPGHVSPGQIHGFGDRPLKALGQRMLKAGLERSTTAGTLTDAAGQSPVMFIRQLPGRARLERSGPGAGVLLVNDQGRGVSSRGQASEVELDLLESLVSDSVEAFFADMADGASGRYLGAGFRANQDRSTTYRGPYYEIFDLFPIVGHRPSQPRKHKRFHFDMSTGLLGRVLYQQTAPNGAQILVETRFSEWLERGGEKVPALIERFEGGQRVLTFRSTSTAFEATRADGIFARP